MLLFTSIKPPKTEAEISYQRDCIASWRAAGFQPVAVNGPGEIEALRGLDLPIEFSPLPTNGKPRIGAILAAIRASGARFAGIINGDCKMIEPPPPRPLDETCIACWRVDEATGYPIRYSFDAFLFGTSFLPKDDHGFTIGSPWWDFWFPWACERNGARIIVPKAANLSHREHPLAWTRSAFVEKGRHFWSIMGRKGDPSVGDLYRLALTMPHHWRGTAPGLVERAKAGLRGLVMPLAFAISDAGPL